jgi:hypothetical protein
VLIDTERADFVDRDIRDTLERFIADAPRRSIAVENVQWPRLNSTPKKRLPWARSPGATS